MEARRALTRTNTDGPQFRHLEGLFHSYFCKGALVALQIAPHKQHRCDVVVDRPNAKANACKTRIVWG